MGKTAILAIKIIGDATEAVTSLEKVDGSAKSMESTMNKASAGSVVALGALAIAAKVTGDAASEAQQAAGAVDSVFGNYASKVHDYAAAADEAVGLSEAAYESLASVLGAQLKNMGMDLDAAGGQTQDLIKMGSDLAATFGGTTTDAVSALSSLLRGERDPIERYGVSMNEAAVQAKMAEMGLEGLTGEAEKNAKLQATLAILTEQTADAQGQFGREADTAAGQQQRADAAWANAAATLGEQLLPIMSQGAMIMADLAEWTGQNTELVTGLAIGIAVLASGILIINGAMKVYAAIQAVQTAAQWANNTAWLASPITWIILAIIVAIAAVIAIVVLLITHWDDVAATAEKVWSGVIDWIGQVGRWFGSIFSAIGGWWNGLVADWRRGIDGFIGMIRNALNWLAKLVDGAVPGWVKDMLGMSGRTISARMVVDDPPFVPSLMAFTAAETTAGFAQPTAFAAPTVGLSAAAKEGLAATGATAPGDTYYVDVHVDGIVQSDEDLARKLRKVLEDSDKTNGRAPAVVVGS